MDKAKRKLILSELWRSFQDFALDSLKEQGVKFALKKLIKDGAAGGIKVWLVKFLATEAFEEIGEPLLKAVFVELGYTYDKVEGNIQVKRLAEARKDDDEDAYNDVADDIMS